MACSKTANQTDEKAAALNIAKNKCSINMKGNNYQVDTNLILIDSYKLHLISGIEADNLSEVKTVEGIPDFIMTFLNNTSSAKKFVMANPGEEWQKGITSFGHQVITKTYDKIKKDTVYQVGFDGKSLPKKQLVFFSIGKSFAILSYYTGGLSICQNVALFKYENNKIIDFWYDNNIERAAIERELIKQIKQPNTKRNGC